MSVEKASKEELAFWDTVLHDHKLGMDRGRRAWLSYGHEDRGADASPTEDDYSEGSNP